MRSSVATSLAGPSLAMAAVAACQCSFPEETVYDCRGTVPDCAYCDRAGTCVVLADGGAASDAGQPDSGPGGGSCAPFAGQRICSVDGVCWEHPLPQGNDLVAVWGTASSGPAPSVWAVGATGTILHFDGAAWSKVESGTRNDLLSVWTDRADEAWVAGSSGAWFKIALDGTRSPVGGVAAGADLTDLWGDPGSGSIWAVGYGGKVYRVNRSLALPALDLSTSTTDLYAVSGRPGGGTVFAAGARGQVDSLDALTGLRTGSNPLPYDVFDLWEADDGVLWLATREGGLYSGDGGSAWSPEPGPSFTEIPAALWGRGSGSQLQLWTAGFGGLSWARSQGAGWTGVTDPSQLNLRDVWSDPGGGSTVWAVGEKGFIATAAPGARWDQAGSGLFPTRPSGADLLALQPLGCEAWAVGRNGQVLHRTDAGWTQQGRVQGAVTSVWAAGVGDVWYGGERGRVDRILGGPATTDDSGLSGQVLGLSGAGSSVWAVGEDGGIARWDGLDWTRQNAPTPVNLNAVLARAPDDVWAAGDYRTVIHYDGNTWSTLLPTSGGGPHLRALAASGSRLYAVGDNKLFTYDGTSWSSRSDVTPALSAVTVDDQGRIWVAGAGGFLAYVQPDGGAWKQLEVPTAADLHAIGFRDGELLVAGDDNAIFDVRPGP